MIVEECGILNVLDELGSIENSLKAMLMVYHMAAIEPDREQQDTLGQAFGDIYDSALRRTKEVSKHLAAEIKAYGIAHTGVTLYDE